jgi:toxin CptA
MRLAPSQRLAALLGGLHAFAAGAVLASGLPASLRAILVLAIGAALANALLRHAWRRHRQSVVALRLEGSGAVSVGLRSGETLDGRVREESLVHPAFVVLRLDTGAGRRTALIVPGSVDREAFRRLRVRLRWLRAGGSTPAMPPAGAGP